MCLVFSAQDFIQFFAHFGGALGYANAVAIPIKALFHHPMHHFLRSRQRWQVAHNAIEGRFTFVFGFGGIFLLFNFLPIHAYFARGVGLHITKHMRVAALELGIDAGDHIATAKIIFFGGDLGL